MSIFLLPENAIFLVSFLLILAVGVLEIAALIVGASVFAHADAMLSPHIEAGDSYFAQGFDWLNTGRLPLLVLIILFLGIFSISGFVIQWMVIDFFSAPLPTFIAAIAALFLTVFGTKYLSVRIAHFFPQHESSAISEDSFVGCIAMVTGAPASINTPTECRLTDKFNQVHYVLVEPEEAEVTFTAGDKILITSRLSESRFKGVKNPWPGVL